MARAPDRRGRRVILCADDYGMSEGVSRGIQELVTAGRLTATSAMVTFPRWPDDARAIGPLRRKVSLGLHLNLTVGRPLGPMPRLARDGRFPALGELIRSAVTGRLDIPEIEAEVRRQIEAFVAATGHAPDHVDGHQHVHALPGVRHAVLGALRGTTRPSALLVRDPSDRLSAIVLRGGQAAKALSVAALSRGFGAMARAQGYLANDGFSGFSAFATGSDYADELERAMRAPGSFHMVMCHPGYPDSGLRDLDPVVERRGEELVALQSIDWLQDQVGHVLRADDGDPIDWRKVLADGAG